MTKAKRSDFGPDEPITLMQALEYFPRSADGELRSYDVVLRWVHAGVIVPGVGRVKLGHTRVGKLLYTTRAQIEKFIADCSKSPSKRGVK